jgi:branched-chain amino acid transport system permease protein
VNHVSELSSARRPAAVAALAVVIVFALLPGVLSSYATGLCVTALVYAILAVSLDLVWGLTGVIDLGHTVWFGIGALGVGTLTTTIDRTTYLVSAVHSGLGLYILGTLLGMAVAAVVALGIGLWVFSFRGGGALYVVVVTLAATVVAGILYIQVPSLTGGDNGLFGFNLPSLGASGAYWLCLIALLVVLTGASLLARSDFGVALRAVRDNEERAGYLGINALAVKAGIFVLGALLAAFAGGLYATVDGVVSSPLFDFVFATEVLIWVAVGGRGTILGPALAAFGMSLATSYLSGSYAAEWLLAQGVLFVVVVLFLPDGILPAAAAGLRRLLHLGDPAHARRALVAGEDPSLGAGQDHARELVRVRSLELTLGSLQILRGVEIDLRRAELLAIVGPNGAGKTTLLSVLADGRMGARGEITPALAELTRHRGRAPYQLARAGLVRKFQVPQLFASLTPADAFLIATHRGRGLSMWRRSTSVTVPPAALEVLTASGAAGHENRVAADLPHGIKQGTEIALTVAMAPELLLMDEPCAGLTSVERTSIGEVLRRLSGRGIGVVLIEHDLDFVEAVADRIVVMHEGAVIHQGAPESLRESEMVRSAYIGVTE